MTFFLDWAYYEDIKIISIGLGISFGLMVISFFLFYFVKCFESKEKKDLLKVEKNKIKFFDI